MEKRLFLAIAISLVILVGWTKVAKMLWPEQFADPPAKPAVTSTAKPGPAPTATSTAATATTATSTTSTASPAASVASGAIRPAAAASPVSADRVIVTEIDTPEYIARFSNRGAQLVSFRLKRYLNSEGKTVELVKARDPRRSDFPFSIQTQERERRVMAVANTALYSVSDRSSRGERVLEYRYVAPDGLSITKSFRLSSEFLFKFGISVSPALPYRVVVGPGIRTLEPDEVDSQIVITGNGLVERDGKLKIFAREKGDGLLAFDSFSYVGLEDNYFLTVIRPEHGGSGVLRRIELPTEKKGEKRKEFYAAVNAAPDGRVTGETFFGPKETKILDRHGLGEALQFGWLGIIARFFLEALVWINKTTHNYGFAIIVLTIIIKIALYPLQHKSIVSMKKMQRVQPKMEAIKARYKKAKSDPEQRQKMNAEMMKLYQQEGINPMAGCLPIVFQLPILWGFYSLLSRAIELRGAPFMLWIHDLSLKDPTYVLPILMTATMFIQTWITPSTGDPAQRRMFLMLPLIFGFFFKDFPSGLVLYWLVQNILTIAQQMIMNKWWKDHPDDKNKDDKKGGKE